MDAMTPDIAVAAVHVKKTFKVGFMRQVVEAVKDVSFQVQRGEVFGFLGPNGAGKTTTIKMLMGLVRADAGHLSIFGQTSRLPQARAKVGFLPEQPYFYDYLKPAEFLSYIGSLQGLKGDDLRRETGRLLERVGITGPAANRTLRKFSKGMLQRVGIAQALIGRPELVVLDEPLSGLDPIGRKDIKDILMEVKAAGTTLFFSSHILSDIEMLCDRVAIVDKGRVVLEGSMAEVLEKGKAEAECIARGPAEKLPVLLEGMQARVTHQDDSLRIVLDAAKASELNRGLVGAGFEVLSIARIHTTLEEVFVRTAGKAKE